MTLQSLVDRLKERKVAQWMLGYAAGGWLAFEIFAGFGEPFGLSLWVERIGVVLVLAGGLVVLILAWYHGEKGHQRMSATEVLLITGVMALAGVASFLVRPDSIEEPTGPVWSPAGLVTSFEGFETHPEISPAGDRIVFSTSSSSPRAAAL